MKEKNEKRLKKKKKESCYNTNFHVGARVCNVYVLRFFCIRMQKQLQISSSNMSYSESRLSFLAYFLKCIIKLKRFEK